MAPGVRLLQHRSTAQHGGLVARSRNLPWVLLMDGPLLVTRRLSQRGHGAGGERWPLSVFTTKPIPAPMPPQINPPTAHNGSRSGAARIIRRDDNADDATGECPRDRANEYKACLPAVRVSVRPVLVPLAPATSRPRPWPIAADR